MSRLTYLWITLLALFLSSQVESSAQSRIEKIAGNQTNITINISDTEGDSGF